MVERENDVCRAIVVHLFARRPTHANSKFDPSILPFIGLLDCARAGDGKVTKEGELRPL